MTLKINPRNANEHYNRRHASKKSTIERVNGILKRRFACLKFLKLTPEKSCSIILAVIVLYNFCGQVMGNVFLDTDDDDMPDVYRPSFAGPGSDDDPLVAMGGTNIPKYE